MVAATRPHLLEHSNEIVNVHKKEKCYLKHCSFHAMTDHPFRLFPQRLSKTRPVPDLDENGERLSLYAPQVLRVCSHGMEHPDPDIDPFLYDKTHKNCDGCCGPFTHLPGWGSAEVINIFLTSNLIVFEVLPSIKGAWFTRFHYYELKLPRPTYFTQFIGVNNLLVNGNILFSSIDILMPNSKGWNPALQDDKFRQYALTFTTAHPTFGYMSSILTMAFPIPKAGIDFLPQPNGEIFKASVNERNELKGSSPLQEDWIPEDWTPGFQFRGDKN
jgi:hypothetical protein